MKIELTKSLIATVLILPLMLVLCSSQALADSGQTNYVSDSDVVTPTDATVVALASTAVGSAVGLALLYSSDSTNSDGLLGAGAVILGASLIFGPSAGMAWSGDMSYAARGILGRLGLMGAGLTGVMLGIAAAFSGNDNAEMIAMVGAGMILAVPIWGAVDIFLTPKFVREQIEANRTVSAGIAPMILADGGGLVMQLQF